MKYPLYIELKRNGYRKNYHWKKIEEVRKEIEVNIDNLYMEIHPIDITKLWLIENQLTESVDWSVSFHIQFYETGRVIAIEWMNKWMNTCWIMNRSWGWIDDWL